MTVRNQAALLVLFGCAAVAWYFAVLGFREMTPGPGTMGLGLAGFLAAWTLMMAAMMLPALSPLKDFCLRHCRSPVAFLLPVSSYKGRLRDLRVGLYHGLYCTGCCWGLMVVLIAVGVMNLAWMAVIAVTVLLEKSWSHGRALSRIVGAALIIFAFFALRNPALLPGLYMSSGM